MNPPAQMNPKQAETKHTPEPWGAVGPTVRIGKPGTFNAEDKPEWGGFSIHDAPRAEANAARIVACVNSLAGLNPDGVAGVVDAFERFVRSFPDVKGEPNQVAGTIIFKELDALRRALAAIKP